MSDQTTVADDDFAFVPDEIVMTEDEDEGNIADLEGLDGQIRAAYENLQKAAHQLLIGHHRAGAEYAADAVNQISACRGFNIYATY